LTEEKVLFKLLSILIVGCSGGDKRKLGAHSFAFADFARRLGTRAF
jgi:hypothetical protein